MQLQDLKKLEEGLSTYGITLSEKQMAQFVTYGSLLQEWNQKMNLTAITESEEIAVKHFLDSLLAIRVQDFKSIGNMIDIGTGAGFPGIPLKILYPDLRVTLLDSLKKRVTFLINVIEHIELNNITAVHGRAEDIAGSKEHSERYDLCVSRAVANLSTLSEYCLPFVKVGGHFLSYKGPDAADEIKKAEKAWKILGGVLEKTDEYTLSSQYMAPSQHTLPSKDNGRTLIFIRKNKTTPAKYPRQAGTPAKKPL